MLSELKQTQKIIYDMFSFTGYSGKVKTTGTDNISGLPEIEKGGGIDNKGTAREKFEE